MALSLIAGCPCTADVKNCMVKVQTLKYAEEACYNGTLIITAFSSGLEIGTCNWTINGPKRNIVCLSSSVFLSGHAMTFNYTSLQRSDLILYSDFSLLDATEHVEDDYCSALAPSGFPVLSDNSSNDLLLNGDDSSEEMEKLAFVCSCAIDSVKAGGSVLFPVGRLGIVLLLLEQISSSLDSSALKVPIFIISSVAEELLAFSNVIPEWLSEQRQEKLYSGEPLFAHVDLIKEKKLHLFPAIHSPKLLTMWQEPCIVFCPHWSLRLGPAVHFLRRWRGDQNSLLIMEKEVDADMALLPFKPMAMKVLQCSFLSGIKSQKVQPLLQMLQPKLILFPEILRRRVNLSTVNLSAFIHYSENETLAIPSSERNSELDIATDLGSQLQWRKVNHGNMNIARLKGELFVENGIYRLRPGDEKVISTQSRRLMHWGAIDLENLMMALKKIDIHGSVEQGMSDTESGNVSIVRIVEPNKALIEANETCTIISTADDNLASRISETICRSLDGI